MTIYMILGPQQWGVKVPDRALTHFDHIWIWFHLHVPPAVTNQPMSIHHKLLLQLLLSVDMFVVSHPPALMVPVHDLKLFPQPPTEGGVEKEKTWIGEGDYYKEPSWKEIK